ncbi:MAG: hypothetical protein ACRDV9_11610 [Acidimicrobiia bacterium]
MSAWIDGEEPGAGFDALDLHLSRCDACRSWLTAATSVSRTLRISLIEPRPELAGRILAAFPAKPARPEMVLPLPVAMRIGLAFVALVQLALGLPGLFTSGEAGHLTMDLASWEVALAVGFLFAAYRPERASGMLPLVAALVVLFLGMVGHGAAVGVGPSFAEVMHLTDVAGLGLLWVLARTQREERQPLVA